MVRKLLLLSVALLSAQANAQDREDNVYFLSGWGLGLSGSFSKLETSSQKKPYVNWHLNILANYDLSKNVTVRSGLAYSSYGFSEQYTSNNQLYKVNYKMNSIKVPLEISYYLENRFGITLGVAGLINVDDKFKFKKPFNGKVEVKDSNSLLFSNNFKLSWRSKNKNEIYLNYEEIRTPVFKNNNDLKMYSISLGAISRF